MPLGSEEIEIDSLIVKIASRCNLDCDYCYIYHGQDRSWESMPFRMPDAVVEGLIDAVTFLCAQQEGAPLVAFHGGEPLLFGLAAFDSLVTRIKEQAPRARMTIQSNGTIYNSNLEAILKKHRSSLSFSLSVDGFQEENDRHRVDRRGASRFRRIRETIERARDAQVLDAILMVVDLKNSPDRILEFMHWAGAPQYDLLLPDGDRQSLPPMMDSLDACQATKWVLEFSALYCKERRPFGVRMLDDIIERLLLEKQGLPRPSSSKVRVDLTVDTNGEIKLVDTLRINRSGADFAGGFKISRAGIDAALCSPELRDFLRTRDDVAQECENCRHFDKCGGGYMQHRWDGESYRNPSVYCSDYKQVFGVFERALT